MLIYRVTLVSRLSAHSAQSLSGVAALALQDRDQGGAAQHHGAHRTGPPPAPNSASMSVTPARLWSVVDHPNANLHGAGVHMHAPAGLSSGPGPTLRTLAASNKAYRR